MKPIWVNTILVFASILITLTFLEITCGFLIRSKGKKLIQAPILLAKKIKAEHRLEIPETLSKLPNINPHPDPVDMSTEFVDKSLKFPRPYSSNENGLFTPYPGLSIRSILKMNDGSIVYDVGYTIDEFGRRIVPGQEHKKAKSFALFMGDSMTFGEGVNNNETIPYYFSKKVKNMKVYNLGFHGYSPADILVRIRKDPKKYWEGINEKNGFAMFSYITDHINRVMGPMSMVTTWGGNKVYLSENSSGQIVQNGTFQTSRPILQMVYSLLYKSNIVQYFGLNFPLYYTLDDIKFFVKIVAEIKQAYVERFGNDHFYFLFLTGNDDYNEALCKEFDAAGIRYLVYNRIWVQNLTKKPTNIAHDGHHTAEANKILGTQLANDIPLDELAN
jgi:hypothetical protein